MNNAKAIIPFGFLLALGLVISTHLVTDAMRDIRMSHQIIKVRGYAETQVESDLTMWSITVKTRNGDMTKAYSVLARHREKVLDFLKENGVESQETNILSVDVDEHKKLTEKGHKTSETEMFELSQGIEVKSRDVQKISRISTTVTGLLGEGIDLQARMPRYYYTQVNELKSDLLVAATKDARMRAQTLAEGSGVELGPLRAARQGVFRVRSADSSNISERSGDDVSSISKKITSIVTVDYAMQ